MSGTWPHFLSIIQAPIGQNWLRVTEQPLAFDVGANEGFFACHLAQMIGRRGQIYAFEPVPETFAKLAYSVSRLGLTAWVKPIPAAVLDSSGLVQLSWPDRNSLEAQVTPRLNRRADHRLTWAHAIPLDTFCALIGSSFFECRGNRRGPEAFTFTPGPRKAGTDSFSNHRTLELGKGIHFRREMSQETNSTSA
jgi:FkbM family methyltransferase